MLLASGCAGHAATTNSEKNMRAISYLLKRITGRMADLMLHPSELSALPEIRHLRQLIKLYNVDCVFDVGANKGQYASMLRHRVGFRGRIISFEPTPRLYDQLVQRASKDPLWHVANIALSDFDGVAEFNVMTEGQFNSLKKPSTDEVAMLSRLNSIREVIPVTCKRLDSLYQDFKRDFGFSRPFLKMDTQGNDIKVFKGASGIAMELVGLQSELSFKRLYQDSPRFAESIETYNRGGFELCALVPNNEGHFPRLLEMDCIMVNQQLL